MLEAVLALAHGQPVSSTAPASVCHFQGPSNEDSNASSVDSVLGAPWVGPPPNLPVQFINEDKRLCNLLLDNKVSVIDNSQLLAESQGTSRPSKTITVGFRLTKKMISTQMTPLLR
jgi:hypothetical protein